MIEKLLHIPTQLSEQWTFQMAPITERLLIEKYYDVKDSVVREILGKKLSQRNRKELDDVSEKTGISIKSCRRQFDNIKRVYKLVEDMAGRLCHNIQTHFLLPPELAKKYAAIVYFANNRFETNKRKLQYLQVSDYLHCSIEIMNHWSCPNHECKYEESSMEVDREFVNSLRDLRILIEKDFMDEHRVLVIRMLKPKINDKKICDIDLHFKVSLIIFSLFSFLSLISFLLSLFIFVFLLLLLLLFTKISFDFFDVFFAL